MRISKEQTRRNHDHVVEVAARLFRERGFDGIGVAELMKLAGFTHGGFYNHFDSKEALAAEASEWAFQQLPARRGARATGLAKILKLYLSAQHRAARGDGCPAAALCADAARQTDQVKKVFAAGIESLIERFERAIGASPSTNPEAQRALAINLLAKAVGALVLSRAIPSDDELWQEILAATLASSLVDIETISTAGST